MASEQLMNDDVDLTPIDESLSIEDVFSPIEDRSSVIVVPDPATHDVNSINATDSTNRIIDGWIKDVSGDAGDPGETYPNIPPEEKEPLADPIMVRVVRKQRTYISDYSSENLIKLHNAGGKFYVIYSDGSENEIEYTEIYNPHTKIMKTIVNEADAISKATAQYFWNADDGVHVSAIRRAVFDANAARVTGQAAYDYHNILMNSLGILLRRALINLVAISRSAISFYDGLGNEESNITAYFGRARAQIGPNNSRHLIIDDQGFHAEDGEGNPIPINNIDVVTLSADTAKIHNLTADELSAATGYIAALTSDNVSAQNLIADVAKIHNLTADQLSAATGYIATLTSDNVSAQNLIADIAKIHNLTADQLSAATGYIATLTSDNVSAQNLIADIAKIHNLTADQLSAATAYVTALTSNNITTTMIRAGLAAIDSLDVNYAQINLANVNNAWMTNGIINDGAIVNAQIHDVSANKLTAGTIDASVINVTNLTASDISVQRINGQVVTGKTIVDALRTHETDISNLDDKIDNAIDDLNDRIDARIQTYTSNSIPTMNNYPASDWNTDDLKQEHVGDILYVVNAGSQADGYTYRFAYDNTSSTYQWVLIRDNQVTAALQRIIDAEGDIDNLQTFQSTTSTWMNNTDNELTSVKSTQTSLTGRVGTLETTKVDSSTFNSLSQTVDTNASKITALTQKIDTIDGDLDTLNGTVTTVSNTVNNVQQSATSNTSKISNLTTRLGLKADGTAGTNDIVKKVSDVTQDLNGFKTTVSNTYATQNALGNEINLRKATYVVSNSNSSIVNKVGTCENFELYTGARITCVFANANTAKVPTLNVNSTGAKQIRSYVGAPLSEAEYKWASGSSLDLVYDGTYWRIQDGGSTTRIYNAETAINQNAEAIELRATKTEVEGIGASLAKLENEALDVIYSHTYEHNGNIYTFNASLKQGSIDITNNVDPMRFVWYIKDEHGIELVSRGIQFQVSGSEIGYRGSVIGGYEDAGLHDYHLVDNRGRNFVTKDTGKRLVARIVWEE